MAATTTTAAAQRLVAATTATATSWLNDDGHYDAGDANDYAGRGGDCGSPLYVVVEAAPQTAYLAVGTLDDTHDLRPECHGWTASKQEWIQILDSATQHEFEPHLQPESPVTG